MKKEDVQTLLTEFGFSVTVNKGLEKVKRTHMMHAISSGKKLVEYYIDEALGSISTIFGFHDNTMETMEDITDLETWLNK